jgi:nucleotide-binding universal stress UspA family protein
MKEIKKILCPVDFSESSKKIVPYAVTLAEKFNAKLYLIYVVEGLGHYAGYIPHTSLAAFEGEVARGAEKNMQNFVEEHLEGFKNLETRVVIGGISEEINKLVTAEGIGLIVMGTHGRKGLDKAIFGSVAGQVVKSAPCPVMTVNPYKV